MGGRRGPTMADVAAAAGVSLSTVSLTYSGAGPISDDMRDRVLAAAADLGYHGPSPQARALRSGRTGVVGLIVGTEMARYFRDPLSLAVLDATVDALGAAGKGVLLLPTSHAGEGELVETAAMDGAIVLRNATGGEPFVESLSRRGIPAIFTEAPEGVTPAVNLEDAEATASLIRQLAELGHTRIGAVTLPWRPETRTTVVDGDWHDVVTASVARTRLTGFDLAGVEPCVVVEARSSLVEEGIEAARIALAHPSAPTALVCQSDVLAAGVIVAAREQGLTVPGDLSVTGIDAITLPWLAPTEITTAFQDAVAKGQALARGVVAMIDGEEVADVRLPMPVRAGTTTGAAPQV